MPNPDWLRPSTLPRLAKCRASGITSEGCISSSSDATELGRALHELAAIAKQHGVEHAMQQIPAVALSYAVSEEAISGIWGRVESDDFWIQPSSNVEIPVDLTVLGIERKGTVDFYEIGPDAVEVVDHKTGDPEYVDFSDFWQLDAYAVALALKHKKRRARCSLWYWQLGTEGWAEGDFFDAVERRVQIEDLVQDALAQIALEEEKRSYRTGDHCTFCPGRIRCPAFQMNLSAFLAVERYEPPTLTVDNAALIYQRAGQVEKLAKAAKDAVKELIRQAGPILDGEQHQLELRTVSMPERKLKATTFDRIQRVKRMAG